MDIGFILNAFGLKGEVRIRSLRGEPERFLELRSLMIVGAGGTETTYEIERVRIHKGCAVVKLEGVVNRTQAEALRGCYVRAVGEGEEFEDEEDDLDKLIGLEVFTKTGERLGILEEVIVTGANDVYEVRDGEKSVLLPAIDDVIVSVDFETGRMIVDPLPGLL